ncbi:histamine H2 receptor isoform X1 [Hydra vulgaris]|uniref:histamine H2 receptor isoform X1 n=1 Tax=Hydra vulgaris TaxID=6087 RepID=UPI0006412293|nr:histamine H2 receptor [Hydra vulgaris]XP_047126476.1 histamine H2 receptor [Hydra vulgaris]
MMNNTCEKLIQDLKGTPKISPSIISVILPEICNFVNTSPNASRIASQFQKLCCSPISSIILNKTLDSSNGINHSRIEQVCRLMSKNNKPDEEEFYNEFCLSWMKSEPAEHQILTYVLASILSPIGLFANILILTTVYKVKKMQNPTGYFICNLAIADLFVILETLLFHTFYKSGTMSIASERVQKFMFPSLDIMLGSASLLHVTAVSIERGIAVALPMKYPFYLSELRAKRLIQGIWVYCTLIFFLSISRIWVVQKFYEETIFFVAVSCSFFIPFVLVTTSYGIIMFSALKSIKMEHSIRKVIAAISRLDDNLLTKATVRPPRFREIKITFNVMTMTIPFVCGWGYFMTCSTYEIAANYKFKGFQNWLIMSLPFLVSCINPLTYIVFTRSLRQSSFRVLSNLCSNIFQRVSYKRKNNRRNSNLNL